MFIRKEVLLNLGNTFSITGDYVQAELYYENALSINRQTGNVNGETSVLYNQSLELYKKGERDCAIIVAES